MKLKIILLTVAITALSACSGKNESSQAAPAPSSDTGRWYNSQQVDQGKNVFAANCARCHGDKAQGLVSNWKQPSADGKYPAPPLDGSAHAWHHPKAQLLRTISSGGAPVGGTMPAFSDKLTDDEKLTAIAYFQSFWSEDIYKSWNKRNEGS